MMGVSVSQDGKCMTLNRDTLYVAQVREQDFEKL
jgi:hypothetical protein